MADLASQPTSIQTVYAWYREGKLFVNRRYQRKLVWTLEEKQKLIGSLLKKYPVPAILLAERDGSPGTYEIIDGLQRLHTIVSFIEQSFSLDTGVFFDVDKFPTAKAAAEDGAFPLRKEVRLVTARQVSTILDYALALSVMRNATDDEVNDVFDRINTYGHRLSDQERRQSGVQNEFSATVREVACLLRGDTSVDILPLGDMPSISIDLPMSNHGYEVKADEVFWVNQGILRSTDLRDSLDEQCIADILACIVRGELIERSKDALDMIYARDTSTSEQTLNALEVYGSSKAVDEIKFCIGEILKVCNEGTATKLRSLLFSTTNTNAFPSVFAVLVLAFYEIIIQDEKRVSSYAGIKSALSGLSDRIETGRKATSSDERRKNVDVIKGLVAKYFVRDSSLSEIIYSNHTALDIESLIRRSEIEVSIYELKQGILQLVPGAIEEPSIGDKIIRTICGIANVGPKSSGRILIGVTNKKADAERVKSIDDIEPKKIGRRFVVGVERESRRMGITLEQYFSRIKDIIRHSALSPQLRDDVLSHLEFNSFYGLGVIVITIPPQRILSYVGDDLFWREGDSTVLATGAKQIAGLAARFLG